MANLKLISDASAENPTSTNMTNESVAVQRIISPAPEISVIEVVEGATAIATEPPSAPPPDYQESVAAPPQRGASSVEQQRLQTRSQDPFKPPTPPES